MRTFFLIALLVAASVTAPVGSAWSGTNIIKIGVLYNLTGKKASIDTPGFRGMELARDEINSNGGLLGKKLVLIAADCRSEADRTALAAESMASNSEIHIMAGLNDSQDAMVAVPYATSRKKLFIIAGSTVQTLPYMFGKFCYMTAFGDSMQARAAVKFAMRRLGVSKAWIATDISNDDTKTLGKYYKKSCRKYGGKVLETILYNGGNQTFPASALIKTKDGDATQNPDAIFMASVLSDAVPGITALRKAGFNQPILAGDDFDNPCLESLDYDNDSQIYITTHVSFDNPNPVVQHFVNSYRKKYGTDPENSFSALGYDTVMLIARAIEKAGNDNSDDVRKAFAETKGYEGVTGTIIYPEGMRVPYKTVDIVKFEHGSFSFVDQILPN